MEAPAPGPPAPAEARRARVAKLEASATNEYVRTSAQKAKLVLDLIRGKKAADALSILRFTKKSVARDVEKTLRSAIANAVLVADRNQKGASTRRTWWSAPASRGRGRPRSGFARRRWAAPTG